MTAMLAAAVPSKSSPSSAIRDSQQRKRPTTISSSVHSPPIWRQRGKSPSKKQNSDIVDELSGLLLGDNNLTTTQQFSKGAHRFPVELALDSPECNSEASTSSSLDSTTSSTNIALPESSWRDQIPPKSTSFSGPTEIVLRPNRRLLRSEPQEIDALRRWSAMSITSTGTIPPDAVNCDCTSLAWAALRSSGARRRRLQQKQDESYRKTSNNANFSTDSGLGSSSGSEDSTSQAGNLTPMANKPPLVRKRRKRSMSFLGLMRRIFDGDKTKKTYGQSFVAPSPLEVSFELYKYMIYKKQNCAIMTPKSKSSKKIR
jgi:hypothetical protein